MTILTPEAMALLKRMDAEEALQKAVELGLEAAAQVCEQWPLDAENMLRAEKYATHGWHNAVAGVLRADAASAIRALKEQK